MRNVLLVLCLLFAGPLQAAELPSWMAGSWHGVAGGITMDEQWTTAAGGLMLGMHRDVKASGRASFEFLRIEQKDGALVYLAMPGGRPATPFPLKASAAERLVFENAEHDYPQRIMYWRDGNRLCARTEGTIAGKEDSEEWCWERAVEK